MSPALIAPLLRFAPYMAVAIGVGVVLIGTYQAGWNASERESDVATLRTKIEVLTRDQEIAWRSAQKAAADQRELEAQLEANDQALEAIRQANIGREKVPGAVVDQSDVERLLTIK